MLHISLLFVSTILVYHFLAVNAVFGQPEQVHLSYGGKIQQKKSLFNLHFILSKNYSILIKLNRMKW
jgi:hypothetical protein